VFLAYMSAVPQTVALRAREERYVLDAAARSPAGEPAQAGSAR
jgi:hypothetical protein